MKPMISKQLSMRGVSLVELMVSLAIGLFLVLGATTIYLNSRKTSDVDEAVARLHETARYALSVMEADARMANYWGVLKDGREFVNKIGQLNATNEAPKLIESTDAAKCGANFAVDISKYIEATNNQYKLACKHATESESADTLTVRRAAIEKTVVDATKERLQVCVSRGSAELIRGGTCANEVHDVLVHTYYINNGSDQNSTYPSLRRRTLVKGPDFRDAEIIPGVEDLQIELGWGAGTDGAAVQYVQPENAVLASGQVVAVRIWLLIRAENRDMSFKDTRTYEYGDRRAALGKTTKLNDAAAAGKAYEPADNYRRVLVSRTIFIRNAVGT